MSVAAIRKNRCRTTVAEPIGGNASGAALYRGSGRLLKPQPGRPQGDLHLAANGEVIAAGNVERPVSDFESGPLLLTIDEGCFWGTLFAIAVGPK